MRLFLVILILTFSHFAYAETDSLTLKTDSIASFTPSRNTAYYCQRFILPVGMIGLSAFALSNDEMTEWSDRVQNGVANHKRIHIDDYIQYMPIATTYGLELCGVKGQNSYVDKTLILATAFLVQSCTVLITKRAVHKMRPDGSSHTSFPSGHTATAFMGAEFMRMEYKDRPWIGVAGYLCAATTGALRIYNNKHDLIDVLGGAGIGILSTRIAYSVAPAIRNVIHGKQNHNSFALVSIPFYDPYSKSGGVEAVLQF